MTVDLPNIISRDAARALGLKCFFTGEPCRHGHVAKREVSGCGCTECRRERGHKYRVANLERAREREREHARKYRAAYPERVRENWRRWRAANPQKAKDYKRAWSAAHKDELNTRQAARRRAARAGLELNAGMAGASEGSR
jgi:hypothetical protein